MILFMFLATIILIGLLVCGTLAVAGGSVFIVMFADVIVCAFIFWLLFKALKKKKDQGQQWLFSFSFANFTSYIMRNSQLRGRALAITRESWVRIPYCFFLVLQIIPKEVLAYSLSCIRIRKSVLGNKQNNHMCVVLQRSSSKDRKEAIRGNSLCLLSEEEKDKSSWEHMDFIVLNEYFIIQILFLILNY